MDFTVWSGPTPQSLPGGYSQAQFGLAPLHRASLVHTHMHSLEWPHSTGPPWCILTCTVWSGPTPQSLPGAYSHAQFGAAPLHGASLVYTHMHSLEWPHSTEPPWCILTCTVGEAPLHGASLVYTHMHSLEWPHSTRPSWCMLTTVWSGPT